MFNLINMLMISLYLFFPDDIQEALCRFLDPSERWIDMDNDELEYGLSFGLYLIGLFC